MRSKQASKLRNNQIPLFLLELIETMGKQQFEASAVKFQFNYPSGNLLAPIFCTAIEHFFASFIIAPFFMD